MAQKGKISQEDYESSMLHQDMQIEGTIKMMTLKQLERRFGEKGRELWTLRDSLDKIITELTSSTLRSLHCPPTLSGSCSTPLSCSWRKFMTCVGTRDGIPKRERSIVFQPKKHSAKCSASAASK